MHDPMTVAFEIRYPGKRNGYRDSFITIWHKDPERNGDEDSCGWTWPKLTDADRQIIRDFFPHEDLDKYFPD